MAWPTDPLDVRCVFAFGANLSAAPTSWTFKDCTSDLRVADEVNIKVGRSDRAKQPEPNQATFTLNNLNGQYTVDNPVGANYPNVVENVPGIIAVARNANPTFEVDASDWAGINGTVARSTVRAFSGAGSLLLTPTGGFSFASANVSGQIPVRAGGAVYVDAWVYSVAGWANTAVAVDWVDGSGTYISTTTGPTVSVPAATWTYLGAYLGPAPSNAAKCNGRVIENGTPGAGNTLWIDEARTSIPRLCGYVDGWTPQFNDTGSLATVAVSMSGARRRLGRGTPVLRSAMYRAVTTASTLPSAYWPCEDGANVSQAVSPIRGVAPMQTVQAHNFSATTGAPGSDQQPDFTSGGQLQGFVPVSGPVTQWRIQCLVKCNVIPSGQFAVPLEWFTTDGTAWQLQANDDGSGGLNFSDSTTLHNFASNVAVDDGLWHEWRATATQSGGNIVLNVFLDNVLIINQTYAGTLTAINQVISNNITNPSSIMAGVGHFIVWNGTITVSGLDTVDSMNGHRGETAGARITRLCTEQGVVLATIADQALSMPMGPQTPIVFLDLLLECEAADMGMMFEPFDGFGFGYIVRSDLYNLPVTLTIDNSQGQLAPPFAPLHDDLQRQNDVTATRPGGASARYVGDTSRGTYQTSVTVNVQFDNQLLDVAAWIVHLGSPRKRLRHPALAVNLTAAPTLVPVFTASLGLGIRAQVINPPSQITVPPDLLISGYTEKLGFKQWVISLLGSPFEVWRVFTIADPVLGRIETDGSALSGGPYASNATSLTVTSSGVPWDTTATPFDVDIGGEQCTATTITGATSPQTFTVTRSVNGVVKQQTAGTPVALWRPGVIAL